jgi:hypothetical protein
MPQQKLSGPEGIRRGGFQGGVHVSPAAITEDTGLLQLADSLAQFTGAATGAATQMHDQRIADLRRTGADEAAQIQSSFQGYTADQIGEALEGEPLAERFRQNPYILPALQVHRGRVAADDTASAMISAGVDPSDGEAVQQYLQENPSDTSDSFFSRGMNEQMDRYRAQWAQAQMRSGLQEAEATRVQAAGREFQTVFEDTGDLGQAVASLRSSELGLRGTDITGILISSMRAAAQRGDADYVESLANLSRSDGIPTLAEDANVMSEVAGYREQADLRARQNAQDGHIQTRTDLYDVIREGATLDQLHSDPRFESLPESMQSMVHERWYSDQNNRQTQARQQHTGWFRRTSRAESDSSAIDLLVAGRGEEITDIDLTDDATGTNVHYSRNERIEGATRYFRDQYLGENPLAVPAEEGEKYRVYTQRLADGDLHDPMLQRYLDGLGGMMTVEGIISSAPDVAQGYTMYSNMDPVTARRYVTDPRSRSVFEQMDRYIQRDPDLDPAEAATRAVAFVDMDRPRLQDTSRLLRDTVRNLEVDDPATGGRRGLFWRRLDPNTVDPAYNAAQAWVGDRVHEYTAYMGQEDAIAMAQADYQSEHTVVNGSILALPNGPMADPTMSRETPTKWHERSTSFLNGLADLAGTEGIEGYTMDHAGGNAYIVHAPDGSVNFYTAEAIRRASEVRDRHLANLEQAEHAASNQRAAEDALNPSTDIDMSSSLPQRGAGRRY